MIGQRLTMRAHVERNQAAGNDAWGQPVAPDFQPLAVLPCFAWSPRASELQDGAKSAQIEDVRALFAIGADIAEDDELSAITRPDGVTVLFPGRLKVEGPVQFKHNHLEAALRRIG